MVKTEKPETLQEKIKNKEVEILDVREEDELEQTEQKRIPNSTHIPFSVLHKNVEKIDFSEEIYVVCRHGNSSIQACRILESYEGSKETDIYSLEGGYLEWKGPLEK